jgi:hypothetical protein
MTLRKLIWIVVGVLLLLTIGGLWDAYGTSSITLTEPQVQARIDQQLDKDFAVRGVAQLLVKSVRIRAATIHLQDGQVTALIDATGMLRADKSFTLTAYAVGVPTYRSGEFFFTPDKIEVRRITYEGGAPGERARQFADRYVSDAKLRQLVEDKAPAVEDWVNTLAQNAAAQVLERRPVYHLRDDVKGMLIAASLSSVKIDHDRLVATFSLWQLTRSVLLGALCLVVGLATIWLMFRHPLFGLALLAQR